MATGFAEFAPLQDAVEGVPEDQPEEVFGFMRGIIRDATGFNLLSEDMADDTASVIAGMCIAGARKVRKVHSGNSSHMVSGASDPDTMVTITCR